MTGITFQKLYMITIGELLADGSINPLVVIEDYRFKANIKKTARQDTSMTPEVNVVEIFNLPPDTIIKLSSAKNLYIQIKAGYRYDEGKFNTATDLPVVYLGSIILAQTSQVKADVITKFYCSNFNDRTSKAKANRIFTAGSSVRAVFDYLGATLGVPVVHYWTKADSLVLQKQKTVEGSTMALFRDWSERYDLRMVSDKGIIKIIDKAVKHGVNNYRHFIPLDRIKGYPTTTIDVSKVIKEGTPPVADVSLNTFLFPEVALNDSVVINMPDYTIPQIAGKYQANPQEYIVNSYVHAMDSHEGNVWTTIITGKGEQQ